MAVLVRCSSSCVKSGISNMQRTSSEKKDCPEVDCLKSDPDHSSYSRQIMNGNKKTAAEMLLASCMTVFVKDVDVLQVKALCSSIRQTEYLWRYSVEHGEDKRNLYYLKVSESSDNECDALDFIMESFHRFRLVDSSDVLSI